MGLSREHEIAREALNDIAILSGYSSELPLPLPDCGIPDVARITDSMKGIFIGDAKHTEHPTNEHTLVRIRKYLKWLANLSVDVRQQSVFALSVTDSLAAAEWHLILNNLANDVGIMSFRAQHRTIDVDLSIIWIAYDGSIVLH